MVLYANLPVFISLYLYANVVFFFAKTHLYVKYGFRCKFNVFI